MEREIVRVLREKGPLTGEEIWEAVGGDGLVLWRTCRLSQDLTIQRIGTRYLRLDRRVDGFARLSPSIFREFLTYSIVGLPDMMEDILQKSLGRMSHLEEVNRSKLELAYRTVSGLASRFEDEWSLGHQVCFIISGDIVFSMAHDVPRPERSTGKLVNGSDIDLVVVAEDEMPEEKLARIDDAIYQEKYRLLITPHLREELDYVVKTVSRVREQIRFDTFKHMVACKILREGTYLYGSEGLFQTLKGMLMESGVVEKLDALERQAMAFRNEAEEYLLREDPEVLRQESLHLFYPTEESEEFE
jgi:hypothetical protein